MLIGYRRSSTTGQVAGYEAQEAALLATGCTRIFGEMASSVAQRDQLEAALAFARNGAVLIACRLDRLSIRRVASKRSRPKRFIVTIPHLEKLDVLLNELRMGWSETQVSEIRKRYVDDRAVVVAMANRLRKAGL